MRVKLLLLAFALWLLFAASAIAASRPKLVVVIAVDQLRSDYLTRFEPLFLPGNGSSGKPGGFRYFTEKGAYYPNAQTAHALNVTAVGHATMLTGALPYLHGVISNYWYDRGRSEQHYCVQDPEAQLIAGTTGARTGRSPRNLLVTTVGDELKNAYGGKPRVVSIALKDRSAILLGGHRADLALWFNESAKGWVTSSYYAKDGKLPNWVSTWNQFDYLARKVPPQWSLLLPEHRYSQSIVMPPDTIGGAQGLGSKFPHPIEGRLSAFLISPWANAYTLDTALQAVVSYGLGRGDAPDLLAISLSAFDALGHNYGPLSIEMQDAALRLDRQLAEFLGQLARQVPGGMANIAIALTADHGVQVNPTMAPKLGLPGGIYPLDALKDGGNDALRATLKLQSDDTPIAFIFQGNIALNHELLKKRGIATDTAARSLVQWLRTQPYIAAAYSKPDLLDGKTAPTVLARKLAVNLHPERSGDVLFAARPGWLPMSTHGHGGTEHESASVHDASVPLAFAGGAFRSGRYHESASLLDLAPTLANVLGIIPPSGSEGQTLHRALRAQAGP